MSIRYRVRQSRIYSVSLLMLGSVVVQRWSFRELPLPFIGEFGVHLTNTAETSPEYSTPFRKPETSIESETWPRLRVRSAVARSGLGSRYLDPASLKYTSARMTRH